MRKPEGPFGDHLGYYSLQHDFPVLNVERVYHRDRCHLAVHVGGTTAPGRHDLRRLDPRADRPDHSERGPGVHAVHAVDAAGVHPLLLAIASERYVPVCTVRRPQEILTIANALLGQGQLSLAKYLLIVAREDDPYLDIHDIAAFLAHLLLARRLEERLALPDPDDDRHPRLLRPRIQPGFKGRDRGRRSATAGAAGPSIPSPRLPQGFRDPRIVLPGILAIQGPTHTATRGVDIAAFCRSFAPDDPVRGFPLIVIVDDSEFTAQSLRNFLWVTFTRSDPAADIDGIDSFIEKKHWGCTGPLVIDARIKPHHAPPLVDDPAVERRVDALAAPGGPLHGVY